MSSVPISELDAPQAMRRVAELRAASHTSVEEAQRIAATFPLTHVDLDVGAGLASLAVHLAAFAPALPQDTDAVLRPRWDAAACAAESAIVEGWADARLMCALRHLEPTDVAEPAPIIARLARLESSDALTALRWGEDVVVRGVLSASVVLALLEPLSLHTDADVRARFVDALGESWLVLTDRVRLYRRALSDSDSDVACRALPHVQIEAQRVRELVPRLGADAHVALVRLGNALDLDAALSVREAVLAHHRAGNFPKPEHVSALLQTFVHNEAWTAEEFSRVMFTCRTQLLDALSAVDANDARWSRLALLLAYVEGRNSQEQSADQVLSDKLRACTNVDVADHLIRAATDHPEFSDEAALFQHVEALPVPCFAALRRHGTERSLPQVLEYLRNPVAFGVARRDALDWCWMIASDRLALIAEYGPESWTDEQLARAASPHPAVAERAREMPLLAGAEPRYALSVLVGVFQDPAELSEPFRRAVRAELVVSGPRRPRDPAVPTAAEQAVLAAERRLITQKRRVTEYRDTGPGRLIRKLTIEWLRDADERDDSRDVVLALGVLARHPIGASQLRYVHPFWRAKNPNVQRAAAEALLACRHSSGLALSLSNLASTDDIRTQRQGLRAMEHFGSRWAEPEAIRALDSPNMNIKKAAASALRVVGSARCVPALIRWLGAYDNPGLRTELLIALDHVAGKAANSLLLEAYALGDRSQRLNLREALQARLTPAQLAAFAHRDETLVDACRAGTLSLASGSWTDVALALRRKQVGMAPSETAIDELERLGFSKPRARAALDEASPRLLGAIRSRLVEWAQFAVESESPIAARWVLRASKDIAPQHALVLASHAETVEDVQRAISALHRVGAQGEDWRLRAIAQLRALNMPAHQRWLALRKLGAVLTLSELEDALATAHAHGAYRELLADVLPKTWRQVSWLPETERHERVVAGWRWETESAERKHFRRILVRLRPSLTLSDVLSGTVPMPRLGDAHQACA